MGPLPVGVNFWALEIGGSEDGTFRTMPLRPLSRNPTVEARSPRYWKFTPNLVFNQIVCILLFI
jgi:hypothetical protein